MNRLWIGIGLLLSLLAVGLGMAIFTESFFQAFSRNLEEAAELALAGNWSAAAENAEKSREMWLWGHRFFSAVTDHAPLEEAQELLSRLELFSREQLPTEFATTCQSLSKLAEVIQEAHSLSWWSLL